MKKIAWLFACSILATACKEEIKREDQSTTNSTSSSSSTEFIDPSPVPITKPNQAEITMLFNGQEWSGAGFANSHLYYAKGLKDMYKEAPHLTLAFSATKAPDNRQLTLALIGFKGEPGSFSKDKLSAGFTGSASGDAAATEMLGNKSFDAYSDLSVTITKYTSLSATEATIDGTVTGSFTKKGNTIENGIFSGVIVKVFNEQY